MGVRKKIFIGNSDVASQISDLTRIFENEFNQPILSYHNSPNSKIIEANVKYNLSDRKSSIRKLLRGKIGNWAFKNYCDRIDKKFFRRAIKECDVFIFFWKTFKEDYSDLKELNKLGKKIIVCFVGNDIRYFDSYLQECEKYNMQPVEYAENQISNEILRKKLSYLRNSEKYAHLIYSRLDQHQLGLRPYYRFNMMVDTSKIKPITRCRVENPVITHAPSNRYFKGTKYILSALEELKKEGIKFQLRLVENLEHSEALKVYQESDIVIDQVLCTGSGKLASECLAMGKVVVAHMNYENYPQNKGKYANYPIVDANPDTLKNVLKDLIESPKKRSQLSEKSLEFAQNVLDYRLFCKDVLNHLSTPDYREFDYIPTFFRNEYCPTQIESISMYNEYTNILKDCDWYSQYINKGERDGLEF